MKNGYYVADKQTLKPISSCFDRAGEAWDERNDFDKESKPNLIIIKIDNDDGVQVNRYGENILDGPANK